MPPLALRPNEEATVLEEKLNKDEAAENARELTLINCVFADPDDLLRCVIRCAKLEALLCVSSGIVLAHVIDQILPKLDHLRNLEFTLDKREERHELEWIRQKIRISNTFSLKRLYVEVTGFARTQALAEMVAKLPSLTELHVHMLHGSLSDLLFMMEGIWSANLAIQCFKITSEVPPKEQVEPRVGTSSDATCFSDYANVCGNLLLRRAPPARNCLRLRDLAVRTEPLHPTDPVIVVINNDEVTHAQMHEAGKRNRWQDVHCLTLVLVGTGTLSLEEIARADANFHSGLLTFFENFKNDRTGLRSLRELNVSSFHFKDELDFTEVLSEAGLTALTALSVTPCGIWHQGALGRLANTCTQLDDLDVRIYTNYRRCLRCWQPLVLCQDPASPLRLDRGRVSFSNVLELTSLDFLRVCRVCELRMSGMCAEPRALVRSVLQIMRQNDMFRCLVINFFGMVFDEDLTQNLAALLHLRFLCLRTPIPHDISVVKNFIKNVTSSSPSLEVMHLHFAENVNGEAQQYTWMRKAETAEQLLSADAALPDDPEPGRLFTDRPCVICSTQTFIGLVKPHNRGARTQV